MYPEFMYSSVWWFTLVAEVFVINTIELYLIANLMLPLAHEKASVKQKLFFAFLIGTVVQTALPFVVLVVTDDLSNPALSLGFSILYPLIVGYLYYVAGVKVLHLSSIRSTKLMGYFFIYYIFVLNLQKIFNQLFPIPQDGSFSFFSSVRLLAFLAILLGAYFITQYAIGRIKPELRIEDRLFVNPQKEQVVYIVKIFLIFSFSIFLPSVIGESLACYLLIALVLIILFALDILLDLRKALKGEIDNQEVHISALTNGINEIRGVKHDLINILQPYSGYLELRDLDRLEKYHSTVIDLVKTTGSQFDLGRRMGENPALISLLESKFEYSKKLKTDMDISIQGDISDLYIEELDLCRCVACLLDNAIEAASVSEQKRVSFALEPKIDEAKLVIVTNSTEGPVEISEILKAGVTSKQGHRGLGLQNVKNVLESYGNCTFNMAYYNLEMSAYIELKKV